MAMGLGLVVLSLLFSDQANACYDTLPGATCSDESWSMEGGWWNGSAIIGGECECTFDFSAISQSGVNSDLSIDEYWGNCPEPKSSCTRAGWLFEFDGSMCCTSTWYQQENPESKAPTKRWEALNIYVSDCPGSDA